MALVRGEIHHITRMQDFVARADGKIHLAFQQGNHHGLGGSMLGEHLAGIQRKSHHAQQIVVQHGARSGGLLAHRQRLVQAEFE